LASTDTGSPGTLWLSKQESNTTAVNSPYAWYVLAVLVLVYMLNSMDRTVLSILAEDLKADFSLSDSQLGFLHGTAFGVFYALFGYPIGRLTDRWHRVNLLAIGLAMWSLMTVLCGLATNVGQLVVTRMGVGIGEATASPAGFSLISDWFSKRKRGTALGFYIGGLHLGAGLALFVGGAIAATWNHHYPTGGPGNLVGWQAAFLAAGVPGIFLAMWVSTLREPKRGLADGAFRPAETRIWSRFFNDVSSVIPPFTLYQAATLGRRQFGANAAAALAVAACVWALIQLTGDVLQWLALGVGYYGAFSSAQSLKNRDPATFALTWGTPAFVCTMVGFGTVSMLNVNMGFWTAPLALRGLGIDKGTVGMVLGATAAIGGLCGVVAGGRISDALLRFTPAARIYVGLAAAVIPAPFVIGMCLTKDPTTFFLLNVPVVFFGNMWIAAGAATVQELVLPRMRGTATTTYFLVSILLGSGLGPYIIGKVSVAANDLATGVMGGLVAAPIGALALFLATRRVPRAEATKWQRAEAAGETLFDSERQS
jgi:MFS family permease